MSKKEDPLANIIEELFKSIDDTITFVDVTPDAEIISKKVECDLE